MTKKFLTISFFVLGIFFLNNSENMEARSGVTLGRGAVSLSTGYVVRPTLYSGVTLNRGAISISKMSAPITYTQDTYSYVDNNNYYDQSSRNYQDYNEYYDDQYNNYEDDYYYDDYYTNNSSKNNSNNSNNNYSGSNTW